ncbi:hypothetical protein ACFYOD_38330, partial [Streptomyces sp. NPDC006703]
WNSSHNSSGTSRSTIPATADSLPKHPNEMTSYYNSREASDTRSHRDPAAAVRTEGVGHQACEGEDVGDIGDHRPHPTGRERALKIVENAGSAGVTHSALGRQLDAEKHLVTGTQLRSWLAQWLSEGVLHQLPDGAYIRSEGCATSAASRSTIPLLLTQALSATVAAGGVISSRALFDVIQRQSSSYRDSSHMGGHLTRLLGNVGVKRPARGKVRLHASQPAVHGFTVATLEQGVSAYKAMANAVF